MSASVNDLLSRSAGQRSLIDAKIKQFEGLRFIGDKIAADRCREEAHALLDAHFDCQAELVQAVRSQMGH